MPIYSLDDRRVEFRGNHHYIAPGAMVAGSVILEDQVSLWYNVVIRADNDVIRIGERSHGLASPIKKGPTRGIRLLNRCRVFAT